MLYEVSNGQKEAGKKIKKLGSQEGDKYLRIDSDSKVFLPPTLHQRDIVKKKRMSMVSGSQAYSVLQMEEELELDDNRRAGPSSIPDKDTRGVSRTNKAIAAISGAAVTSLMSELEVSFEHLLDFF